RLREAHDTVEAVVIGDRERTQTEARRFFGQLLGMAGAVEKGEIRMAVQLRVHGPRSGFVGSVVDRFDAGSSTFDDDDARDVVTMAPSGSAPLRFVRTDVT